jgi:hypothetical protein
MQTPSGRLIQALCAVTVIATQPACQDPAKCTEALQTARKAMQDEFLDMALARQWRDHAGKVCGAGPELEGLDKEIVAREVALAKAVEDKAKKEAEDGKKALATAAKLWKKFEDRPEEERDKKRLDKTRNTIKKMTAGLSEDYAKQVNEFNDKQYKKNKKALDEAKDTKKDAK